MPRKRSQNEPSGGGEGNWMNTYGDLVTLLLTFFVLLYSFSSIDAAKWQELVVSFSGGKGVLQTQKPGQTTLRIIPSMPRETNPPVSPSPTPMAAVTVPSPTPMPTEPPPTPVPTAPPTTPATSAVPSAGALLSNEIRQALQKSPLAGSVIVEEKNGEILVRLVASILFEPGSDRLLPAAAAILDDVAAIVEKEKSSVKGLRTEGHTDGETPPAGDIQSKWDLAGRRAAHVLEYLVTHSTAGASNAYTVGYGDTRPIASDDTAEGRDQNNRVDLIIST